MYVCRIREDQGMFVKKRRGMKKCKNAYERNKQGN